MANTLLTPSVIARTMVGLLSRQVVLPGVVWRDFDTEFAGKVGASITVRVPGVLAGDEINIDAARTADIDLEDIEEQSISVALTKIPYSAVAITDEDLNLRIEDFGQQVLMPQVQTVGERIEGYLASAMAAATYAEELEFDPDDPFDSLVDARKLLNDANVPLANRTLVVGSAIEAAWLKSNLLKQVDISGSSSALREATIGRLAGFTVLGSNAIAEDEAYAMHKSAFILSTRAPAVPEGATFGQSASYQGLAMRWIRDYDARRLQDRSVVSAFAGATAVEDPTTNEVVRAVKINFTQSA